jgi:glycosyltransferase involved in cell wall biosynthesis
VNLKIAGENNRLVHYYRSAFAAPSGVTAAINSWAGAASREGMPTCVVGELGSRSQNTDYPNSVASGVPHYGSGRATRVPDLRDVLRMGDVLILHEGWVASNVAAALQANKMGVPFVCVPHGVYEAQIVAGLRPPRWLRTRMERRVLERAAAAHVFFDSEQPLVRRYGARTSFVLPTGVQPTSERWQGGGGYVLWFGRISIGHKGLDSLLRAWSLTPKHLRPPLLLRGYDYSGDTARLKALVVDLGLSKSVDVGPPVRGAEKAKLIQNCDVYVHPSRWECHSIALLEVMASGTPIVASETMHISRILREAGVPLLSHSTLESWTETVQMARNSPGVSAKVSKLVQQKFDWSPISKRYVNIMQQLRTLP